MFGVSCVSSPCYDSSKSNEVFFEKRETSFRKKIINTEEDYDHLKSNFLELLGGQSSLTPFKETKASTSNFLDHYNQQHIIPLWQELNYTYLKKLYLIPPKVTVEQWQEAIALNEEKNAHLKDFFSEEDDEDSWEYSKQMALRHSKANRLS